MTQEEFEKRMSVLKGKSVAIEREMKNLQNEYLSSYPIQPNDKCIDSEGKVYWISRFIFSYAHSINVHCLVNYQNKDGSRSKREQYYFGKITKIEERKEDKQ
mgnify:CR=1 FL=1